jgi:hypothetical protein
MIPFPLARPWDRVALTVSGVSVYMGADGVDAREHDIHPGRQIRWPCVKS